MLEEQQKQEDAPPGVDFESLQEIFSNTPQTESLNTNIDLNVNETNTTEISGTTPLCDENETKE